jgi:hypothetical protein
MLERGVHILEGLLSEHQDIRVEPCRAASAEQVWRTIDVRGSLRIVLSLNPVFSDARHHGLQVF